MLIIPLVGKLSRNRLPYVTIALILINCLVFFVVQRDDQKKYTQAFRYYLTSGMAGIELAAYQTYKNGAPDEDGSLNTKKLDPQAASELYLTMLADREFQKQLAEGRIITPQNEHYSRWILAKAEFQRQLDSTMIYRYGLIPARPKAISAFTHMFLHGSFMHLLGNMIFLWLVGGILEMSGGRLFSLGVYIITGLCAGLAYALINSGYFTPMVGASGAISGIMGCFTIIYGLQRIKIFYSLGFYFNYARVPAILMLPLWLGNEALQLALKNESNIAYAAHIFGLASGAALGLIKTRTKILGSLERQTFSHDEKDKIPDLLEKALDKIARLDLDGAKPILMEILASDPNNYTALKQLFHIEKHASSEEFPALANRLFRRSLNERKPAMEIINLYREYARKAELSRLEQTLLLKLCLLCIEKNQWDLAEDIVQFFLQTNTSVTGLAMAMLRLAQAYIKNGREDAAKPILQHLCAALPDAHEIDAARELLQKWE